MILVVNSNPNIVREVRSIFFKMGFNSYGASFDAAESYIIRNRVDALVVIDVCEREPACSFCRNIRIKYPKISVIVTYHEGCENIALDLWYDSDAAMPEDSYSTDVIKAVIKSIKQKAGYDYGNLELYEMRLPINSPDAYIWEDIRLELTPIERLIIRYLMLIYPSYATQDMIFECCFNPSIASNPENVASHISDINQKSISLIDAKIISFVQPYGYILESRHHKSPNESLLSKLRRIRGY